LPEIYGYWHVIYERFSRGSGRGLWAKIPLKLKEEDEIVFNEAVIVSAAMKVRRHGGGQKGGGKPRGKVGRG
jgi:hypothetical protein